MKTTTMENKMREVTVVDREYIDTVVLEAKKAIEKGKWRTSVNFDLLGETMEKNFKASTDTHKKALRKACFLFLKKHSLRSLERMFRKFKIENPSVKISLKEEAINLRKIQWKEADKRALELLKLYREEKGNFFKDK